MKNVALLLLSKKYGKSIEELCKLITNRTSEARKMTQACACCAKEKSVLEFHFRSSKPQLYLKCSACRRK